MKLRNQRLVFKICLLGLNLALYFALSFLSLAIGVTRISFTGIPVMFISILYGPLEGILVAGLGEFFYQLTAYGLVPQTPLWLIAPIARALIVGLLFRHKNIKDHIPLWVFTTILSCLVVTAANTFSLWITGYLYEINEKPLYVIILIRAGTSIVTAVMYGILMPVFFEPLIKSGKLELTEVPRKPKENLE